MFDEGSPALQAFCKEKGLSELQFTPWTDEYTRDFSYLIPKSSFVKVRVCVGLKGSRTAENLSAAARAGRHLPLPILSPCSLLPVCCRRIMRWSIRSTSCGAAAPTSWTFRRKRQRSPMVRAGQDGTHCAVPTPCPRADGWGRGWFCRKQFCSADANKNGGGQRTPHQGDRDRRGQVLQKDSHARRNPASRKSTNPLAQLPPRPNLYPSTALATVLDIQDAMVLRESNVRALSRRGCRAE
jgi:hypothetical protein